MNEEMLRKFYNYCFWSGAQELSLLLQQGYEGEELTNQLKLSEDFVYDAALVYWEQLCYEE